jgi:hypothetical protein
MNYDKVRGSPVFCPLTMQMIAATDLLVCDGASAGPKAFDLRSPRAAVTNQPRTAALQMRRTETANEPLVDQAAAKAAQHDSAHRHYGRYSTALE